MIKAGANVELHKMHSASETFQQYYLNRNCKWWAYVIYMWCRFKKSYSSAIMHQVKCDISGLLEIEAERWKGTTRT